MALKQRILERRQILFIFFVYLVIASCAKQGSLAGGRRDEKPPRIIMSEPVNYSTNFKGQRIEIEFDEYVVLKNISGELIISPPLKVRPDVRLRNKSLIIDLRNELRENTTYTLNFGNAIADNNEGNLLAGFEFVFSTGRALDSLSMTGKVVNAFDLLPSKESVNVMLYNDYGDSIPLKEIPVYIGKTDKNGFFRINNISADTYKVFALKDQNSNLLFDLPNEEIAFLDTFVVLTPEFLRSLPVKPDTVVRDTSKTAVKDSTKMPADTLNRKYSLPSLYVDLFLFSEEPRLQYLKDTERPIPEQLNILFNLPMTDNPGIKPVNFSPPDNWYLQETNLKRDTFHLWIRDTTFINIDTMQIELGYPVLDSLNNTVTKLDTVQFLYRKPPPVKGPKKSIAKELKPAKKFDVTSLRNMSRVDIDRDLPFVFSLPLNDIDTSFIDLFITIDSTEHRHPYMVYRDSISLRKAYLRSKWSEKTTYRFEALPGAFTDIYGNVADTLRYKYSIFEKEAYGALILTIDSLKTPVAVQLLDTKDLVLRQTQFIRDGKWNLPFIYPGKYKFKFIFDNNANGKWDPGYYLKGIQPERVTFYSGEVSVRANWDVEVKWTPDPGQ